MILTHSLRPLAAGAALACMLTGAVRANDFFSTFAPNPAGLMPGYGRSVALGPELIVVGSPGAMFSGEIQGAVDVYDRESAQFLSQLRAPFPLDGDRFGTSLALDGDLVLVGDQDHDDGAGAAYLFDGRSGACLGELDPGAMAIQSRFGASVALSGGRAYVGSPNAAGGGAVHVFDVATGVHTRLDCPSACDLFGQYLALDGGTLVVGEPEFPGGAVSPGRAWVFDSQTLMQRFVFESPDPQVGEGFATSLAVSNGILAVGAPERDEGVLRAGAVFLFDLKNGGFLRKVAQQVPSLFAGFGRRIALNSRILVVDRMPQFGMDGICSFDVASGLELAQIPRPNDNFDTSFGEALAMDGTAVLVGEWYFFSITGRAHLVPIVEIQGLQECGPAVANSSGVPATIRAVGTPQALPGCLTLLATDLPSSTTGFFLNARSAGQSMPAGSSGRLCLAGGIGRYNSQVLSSGDTGRFELELDLANTPVPTGFQTVYPGETWRFQAWFRDVDSGGPTSNFTDAVAVTFE